MKSRLSVAFYVIGLVQLVLLLAPAILFSGPPPPGDPHGPHHDGPPGLLGIPPPTLNFLCGFVVIAVGSWLTSRWIRTPLEKLATAAHRLAGGDLKARVAFDRTDELGVVGAAFDNMALRLEQLVRAEKELLANVSHELRTRSRASASRCRSPRRETRRRARWRSERSAPTSRSSRSCSTASSRRRASRSARETRPSRRPISCRPARDSRRA